MSRSEDLYALLSVEGPVFITAQLMGERISLDGSAFFVRQNLHLTLFSQHGTTLDAEGRSQLFVVHGALHLSDINLVRGSSSGFAGGCLFVQGSAVLTNTTITNCTVSGSMIPEWSDDRILRGGAIAVAGQGSVQLSHTIISRAMIHPTSVDFDPPNGAAIHVDFEGTLGLLHCSVSECFVRSRVGAFGGAVYMNARARANISHSVFDRCGAHSDATEATGAAIGGALRAIEGSEITIKHSTFQNCMVTTSDGSSRAEGGALALRGCTLHMQDTTISECRAHGSRAEGGAIHSRGDAVIVLQRSIITHCSAVAALPQGWGKGGGVFVDDGSVLLQLRTQLISNVATTQGSAIMAQGGTIAYGLPAPRGYWVAAQQCLVYRSACPRDMMGNLIDPRCGSTAQACSLTAHANATIDETRCQPISWNQPCDWQQNSALLGSYIQVLPLAPMDGDFPFRCAAGLLGGESAENQRTSLCAGRCPAGRVCASEGSMEAAACPPAYYCPEGSATPLPCMAGTYSNTSGLSLASECISADPGFYATVGSARQAPCLPGSYSASLRRETCLLCPSGSFQRAYGRTACEACSRGFYCILGAATPEPCPGGTTSNATGLYSSGQCTPVPIGFWAPLGSFAPETCPMSGFYCPGALRDDLYGGAKPILMPVGQSTRQVEAQALVKSMSLDMSIDDFVAQRQALKLQLAAQYSVHPSLLTLEAAAGSLQLTMTIATTDGDTNVVNIATLQQSVAAFDDVALASTIGSVTGTTVNVVSLPAEVGTVRVTVPFPCPRGRWCTAGLVVPCPLGTYNPLEDQEFATACILCPLHSFTRGTNSTSRADCVCNKGYFDANASLAVDEDLISAMQAAGNAPATVIADVVSCEVCPVGVGCTEPGSTLELLPLSKGYHRQSTSTVDIRRCPDAGAGCAGASQCETSTSGCVGGNAASPCAEGLTGTFCQLCEERDGVHYVTANSTHVAYCAPCDDASTLATTLGTGAAAIAIVGGLAAALVVSWRRCLPKSVKERLLYAYSTFTPQVKLKTLIGFYMIATEISRVYEVALPDDTQALLHTISQLITLGIPMLLESTPLECLNLRGYTPELLFWACLPFGVVFVMLMIALIRNLMLRNEVSATAVLLSAIRGGALQLLFLVYPILTTKAFEAFPCHEFDDGRAVLRVDVAIECDEPTTHGRAQTAAGAVIVIYPVGLLVIFRVLLFKARHDITSRAPSQDGTLPALRPGSLSEAISFLHSGYRPEVYWWELMEMLRRLVLVGILVIFRQGSIEQLALGTLFALVYSAIQMIAAPYRKLSDNFFASGCSLVLSVLFLLCVFFKYAALTQLPTLNLTPEQRDYTYAFDSVIFSGVMMVVCISAFILLGVVFIAQAGDEARRALREAHAAKARRLRWCKDAAEVILSKPAIPDCKPASFAPSYNMSAVAERFHIFLSHVWGTGQDQMRVVKQRLLEMLPDVIPFLDVDDLTEGKGAEYVDASSVTLIFVSDGYFNSENCMREFLRAVVTGKPMVTLMESEAKKGGLTQNRVLQQLCEAAAPCKKNDKAYPSKYAMWGLTKEMVSWGYEMPSAGALHASLFNQEPIEWNRIGAFQDVSLRLIAESMLPKDHAPTFLQGELTRLKPMLPKPKGGKEFHIYCSPSNVGSAGLMSEVSKALGLNIKVTQSFADLGKCERMLVHLNELTWTSGETSDCFGSELLQAMDQRMPLLLCHEMPGVGGQVGRHGCEFDLFFNNEQGATPLELLQMDIYSQIATPLKGGAWRNVSMVMVAQALAKSLQVMQATPPKGLKSRLTSEVPPDNGDGSSEVASLPVNDTEVVVHLANQTSPKTSPYCQSETTEPQHLHRIHSSSVPSIGRSGRIDQWSKVSVVESPPSARRTRTHQKLVWIQKHELAAFCLQPIEFPEADSSTLPSLAIHELAKVARELQQKPSLKLHVAGHVHDGEDSNLASKRAQVVGGVLMAFGVLPLRLRARGYGSTVRLSHKAQVALCLKSQRRVTLHALSEVCTHKPVEFEPTSTSLSDVAQTLLSELAVLLESQPKIRLTVEAHTDAAENAQLAMARSMSVVGFLHERGVEKGRLVPQGFGQVFPCGDNATDDGRRRNRRVEFLVIPEVTTASANAAATVHAASLALPTLSVCPPTPSSTPSPGEGANEFGRASAVQKVQQGAVAPPVDHGRRRLARERQPFHQAVVDEVDEGTLMDPPGLVTLEEEPAAPETAPAPTPATAPAPAPEAAPAPEPASAPAHVAGGRPPSRKVSDGAVDRFTMPSTDELASGEDYDA